MVIFDIDQTLIPTLEIASAFLPMRLDSKCLFNIMDDKTYRKFRPRVNVFRELAIKHFKEKLIEWWETLFFTYNFIPDPEIIIVSEFYPSDKVKNALLRVFGRKLTITTDLLSLHSKLRCKVSCAFDDNPIRIGQYIALGISNIFIVNHHWNTRIHVNDEVRIEWPFKPVKAEEVNYD